MSNDPEFTYRIVHEWSITWARWQYVLIQTSIYTVDGEPEVHRYESVGIDENAHRQWAERNAAHFGVEIESAEIPDE